MAITDTKFPQKSYKINNTPQAKLTKRLLLRDSEKINCSTFIEKPISLKG